MSNQPERASMSCTRTMTSAQLNNIYSNMNTQIADFQRATAVAKGYQQYRITNIKMRFKSSWDTFSSQAGGYQKPYFYYMLDKTGSVPSSITLEGLKQMGAKPRVLDEKAIVVSWRPTILGDVATNIIGPVSNINRPIPAPFLSTSQNPAIPSWTINNVDHLGIYWGAFSALAGPAPPVPFTYDVEIEVQFEFRKPLINALTSDTPATPLTYADVNRSVDGIVGGPDGL